MGEIEGEATIREARFGDASYLSYLHAVVYREQYGFRDIFEYYVLKGMAEHMANPEGGRLWVAEADGRIVGGIAVVRAEAETAQVRWFVMDPACQGKGIGRRLFATAMEFCRERGYGRVFLWTIDILGAARHLYAGFGFAPTEKKTNAEWTGEPITEERWDACLSS